MCLLICAPKGRVDEDEILENGFTNNSDGAGFAYSHNKKLIVKKGFFDFDTFIKEYRGIPENAPNLVHFRLATSGRRNEENCHPFFVSQRLAFAHNGVFRCVNGDSEYSDTHYFNETIIKPVFSKNPRVVFTKAAQFMLGETIGGYNKIAFLNHLGETIIVNEIAGDWSGGVWFSNSSWLYARSSRKTPLWPVAVNESCSILPRKPDCNSNTNTKTWREFLVGCYRTYKEEQLEIAAMEPR